MSDDSQVYGAIEAGGTKFFCGMGTADGEILDQVRIPTRTPEATLADVCSYFSAAAIRFSRPRAVGLACFGPVDLQRTSPTFGHIMSTPKSGWSNFDITGALQNRLKCPVRVDTDVNAAALAEVRWGAARGLDDVAYVTVGTGIGVGIIHGGRTVHGLIHPEMGHILVMRHPRDVSFSGLCPFHGDCLEGVANGPAVLARIGKPLGEAAPDDPVWEIEADYLGQLCMNLVLSHSPQRIILGGGLMHGRLYAPIHDRMLLWLRNYLQAPALYRPDYLSPPGLGGLSGLKGALSLVSASIEPTSGIV